MEIEQLRKEFNQVLANIAEHSERFTGTDHVPALEVSVMMSKINKLQEIAAILKFKIQYGEENWKLSNKLEPITLIQKPTTHVVEVIFENETIVEEKIEVVAETIKIIPEIIVETTPILKEKSSLSDNYLHTPISSLKDAFSLNDRYLFANELFKKDMALFNEAVKTIDASSSLIEAQEYLNRTKNDFGWDAENERVISFYELVGRRFLHVD